MKHKTKIIISRMFRVKNIFGFVEVKMIFVLAKIIIAAIRILNEVRVADIRSVMFIDDVKGVNVYGFTMVIE